MKKILTIILFLFLTFFITGCINSNIYTEEEHYKRVEKLLKKRYLNGSTEYTGYQLFPVYNEKDEMRYFLIELEPYGYVYVKIVEKTIPIIGCGMYLRDEGKKWSRYTYNDLDTLIIEDRMVYEVDENGEKIVYNVSPFKAANVLNEKKYILKTKIEGCSGTLIAVKRGNKYLNLISMQEFEYKEEYGFCEQPEYFVSFHPEKRFNL